MKEEEKGSDIDSEDVWQKTAKRMKLSLEHGHVCIRATTGFLLWHCKAGDFDPSGFNLAAVLRAASINMPPELR